MKYRDEVNALSPLESVDPATFIGDEETPQNVCDFVVALALAFNDLHDVMMAINLVVDVELADRDEISKNRGSKAGLNTSLRVAMAGAVNELLVLIKNNRPVLREPAFEKVLKAIGRSSADDWNSLVSSATEEKAKGSLEESLVFLRNKVAFHYDAARIGSGFRRYFEKPGEKAYVSRGSTVRSTRFYFADAARQRYMLDLCEANDDLLKFLQGESMFLEKVALTLHAIVTRFPATRNHAWREVRSDDR